MASLWKHPNSPFWTACFTDENGRQVKKSTKLEDRRLAMKAAEAFEEAAKKARGAELTRAAAVIADQTGKLRNAVTQTIRRTLINVPARVASSARKLRLHLPERWPWAREWAALLTHSTAPPSTVVS